MKAAAEVADAGLRVGPAAGQLVGVALPRSVIGVGPVASMPVGEPAGAGGAAASDRPGAGAVRHRGGRPRYGPPVRILSCGRKVECSSTAAAGRSARSHAPRERQPCPS
ncbi:TetR/AcrR family transcriptional regulator [Streptomyces cacaoi]|uniref:TetR/AcrR family transcriptional regulator n=1 Tax=Streptomyces cacaoi TaxID=1898 RepID=UPI003749AA48